VKGEITRRRKCVPEVYEIGYNSRGDAGKSSGDKKYEVPIKENERR
jgi:hypothetical protein